MTLSIINAIKQAATFGGLLLNITCVISCIEDSSYDVKDEEGVLINKDHLWMKDITEKDETYVWPGITPAIYENNVILAGNDIDDKDMILALDLDNGEEVWRWQDFLTTDHTVMGSSEYGINQKGNIWLLQDHYRYYALDLKTGQTIWKEEREGQSGGEGIQIIDNHYYSSYELLNDSIFTPTLIRGEVFSSYFEKIMVPDIEQIQYFQSSYGGMYQPYVYIENGQLFAFLQIIENVNLYTGQTFNAVASYNITMSQYDFTKTHLGDTARSPFSERPLMYKNLMIVNSNNKLFGLDKHTGAIIWKANDFNEARGNGILTSSLYNNVLYVVNRLGNVERVRAINPLSGETIWEDLGRGNAAHSLHFLNGVMYFTSRGDGKLYAYDTQNGDLLWRLESKEYGSFQSHGGIRVVPGIDGKKGKVIVCTFHNVYCYEAER